MGHEMDFFRGGHTSVSLLCRREPQTINGLDARLRGHDASIEMPLFV